MVSQWNETECFTINRMANSGNCCRWISRGGTPRKGISIIQDAAQAKVKDDSNICTP